MEKYIGKCLDSLLIPEFDRVEVIVVNDGSKDRSSEIAHSYADRYPGSIRVIDKANGNYGSCINTALPLCTGRYVKVLDADDTFNLEAFSRFVKLLANIEDEVVVTAFTTVDENGDAIQLITSDKTRINSYESYLIGELDYETLSNISVMHKLTYKTCIFKRFEYHQSEGISYTDSQWDKIPLSFARNIIVTDISLYRYLLGREGQTMAPAQRFASIGQLMKVAVDTIKMYCDKYYKAPHHEFLYKRIIKLAGQPFYNTILAGGRRNMDRLREYDEYLKYNHLRIYTALSEYPYEAGLSFHFINDLRKKNYPANYKLPLTVRIYYALKNRIKGFFPSIS